MAFYYDFEAVSGVNVPRTARDLFELRGQLDDQVPAKTVFERLLLATWNIQALGGTERTEESFWYIAEILSRFDLIAIPEVKRRLDDLERIRKLLGDWWDFVVTDASEGEGGDDERLGFLFDQRKVRFCRVAGEVVLPPLKGPDGKRLPPLRNHWRRRQMSDHLVMWVELPIEFADPYLNEHLEDHTG